jgi:hypothetical protein
LLPKRDGFCATYGITAIPFVLLNYYALIGDKITYAYIEKILFFYETGGDFPTHINNK